MDARLHDLQLTRDGAAILSLRVPVAAGALYDELKDCDVTVEIKKKRNHRSLNANAYAWVLMGKISAASGVPVAEVYRAAWASNGTGWVSDTLESKIEGCTVVLLYAGSSTFDTAQMSRMIDHLIEDARALNIETKTLQELAVMLEEWGGETKK